ncbi:helix-turn-helix domain-containing protein [Curtobacterium sp. NPDC086286]|uniref:helix-turn-helix domain-containing protein n=1 Tax=Curtobacterium sp. NPDC086286 TaxID=3363964 RepID=UPI003824D1D3
MIATGTPLGDYLRARRAATRPEDVDVRSHTRRRVPGLRRDEVAGLAGISQEYYMRLEQGRDRAPSEQVLHALARALLLDDAGVQHLLRLSTVQPLDVAAAEAAVSIEAMSAILDSWPNTPAYIINSRHEVVLSNALARWVVPLGLEVGRSIPEVVFTFPEVRALPTWPALADRTARRMRFYGHPYDPRLHETAARLAEADPVFRRLWERHEVDPYYDGDVRPSVDGYGQITLRHQTFVVPNTPGYLLCAYHAVPGSDSAAALADLADRIAGAVALS